MKIREIFYYLRETKFCLTAINFAESKCVNRIKPKLNFNASTYRSDKILHRFKQKAVEEKRDRETKFRQHESRDFRPKEEVRNLDINKRK